jgi:hypothetical protein
MTAEERRQKIIADTNAVAAQLAREREEARTRPSMTRPPPSKGSQLLTIVMVMGLFAFLWIVIGGFYLLENIWPDLLEDPLESRRQGVPHQELVEYVEVEGECAETHVKVSAPYTGQLRHSRDVTTGHQSVSGYVNHRRDYDARMKRPRDPYRYEPSRAIGFTRLRPEDVQGDVLQLAGVSEYHADEESRRPSYHATCTLRVTRRLDHQPSQQEETAQ